MNDSRPDAAPTVETALVKAFPCTSCGAKLAFKPGSSALTCPYCGAANRFEAEPADVEELDFSHYLKLMGDQQPHESQAAVKCPGCGAEQTLPKEIALGECSFCRAPLSSSTYALRTIKPRALVPFAIDRRQAQERFRNWIGSLWLAPGKLKKYAQSDAGLRGVYVPYWTYDCQTASDYLGERGEDYYEDETVWVRNAQGQDEQQTRRVLKTRWFRASGHVERFHDDILVLASKSFPKELDAPLSGWKLDALVPHQPEYLAGFQTEAYQVGLADGFREAKPVIDGQVVAAVRADIGGDRQRVQQIRTDYSGITFKHILLPLWISSYRFNDRPYRFMINAQTGEVRGESPKSFWKILFLVLGIILALAILVRMLR
jgi:predicted RNA-binding Zn-ribbon protein involved in translation (DUF1610 family)